MHEWALAEAVVATAVQAAREEGLQELTEVTVKVGELQQLETDLFEFALVEIVGAQAPAFKGATFRLETDPATFRCRACGAEWALGDSVARLPLDEREAIHFLPEMVHVYVKCPRCAGPDFEVVAGRGVMVASLTGERSAAAETPAREDQ